MSCSIEGCTNKAKYINTGWCQKHYHRWWRHGDPLFVKAPRWAKGEESHKWSGDNAGYRAVHWRVRAERGLASEYPCASCGSTAEQWAYDNEDADERIETVNGSPCYFSLDVQHYQPMCRPCHKGMDNKRRNKSA